MKPCASAGFPTPYPLKCAFFGGLEAYPSLCLGILGISRNPRSIAELHCRKPGNCTFRGVGCLETLCQRRLPYTLPPKMCIFGGLEVYPSLCFGILGISRNPRSIAELPCRRPGNCTFWGVGCLETLCQRRLPYTLPPKMCNFGGLEAYPSLCFGILGISRNPRSIAELICRRPGNCTFWGVGCLETLCQRRLPYTLPPKMCNFGGFEVYPSLCFGILGISRNPRSIAELPCRRPGNCTFWGVGCLETLCQRRLPYTLPPKMCIFGGLEVYPSLCFGILGISRNPRSIAELPCRRPGNCTFWGVGCLETLCQRRLPYTLPPKMCNFGGLEVYPSLCFGILGISRNPRSIAELICRRPGNCTFWGVGCLETLCQRRLPYTLPPKMCNFGGLEVYPSPCLGILGISRNRACLQEARKLHILGGRVP